ncbi:MAG: hypothetical protein QM820_23610 [Minicystis sp.]
MNATNDWAFVMSGGHASEMLVSESELPAAEVAAIKRATASSGVDTYTVVGPDCHQKPGQLQTMFFEVPRNRMIDRVEQRCVSGPGPWSYNPEGGYDIWVRYFDGRTKAEWRRWHTSHPVTYEISVYWHAIEV